MNSSPRLAFDSHRSHAFSPASTTTELLQLLLRHRRTRSLSCIFYRTFLHGLSRHILIYVNLVSSRLIKLNVQDSLIKIFAYGGYLYSQYPQQNLYENWYQAQTCLQIQGHIPSPKQQSGYHQKPIIERFEFLVPLAYKNSVPRSLALRLHEHIIAFEKSSLHFGAYRRLSC